MCKSFSFIPLLFPFGKGEGWIESVCHSFSGYPSPNPWRRLYTADKAWTAPNTDKVFIEQNRQEKSSYSL